MSFLIAFGPFFVFPCWRSFIKSSPRSSPPEEGRPTSCIRRGADGGVAGGVAETEEVAVLVPLVSTPVIVAGGIADVDGVEGVGRNAGDPIDDDDADDAGDVQANVCCCECWLCVREDEEDGDEDGVARTVRVVPSPGSGASFSISLGRPSDSMWA